MFTNIGKTTTIKGESGKEYQFQLYTFDTFEDIKSAWNSIPALYLFTRRELSNGAYYHTYLYLGETGDLSTRFQNHHKESEIMSHGSNCIGIYSHVPADEPGRLNLERDLLLANKFPCNDQLQ